MLQVTTSRGCYSFAPVGMHFILQFQIIPVTWNKGLVRLGNKCEVSLFATVNCDGSAKSNSTYDPHKKSHPLSICKREPLCVVACSQTCSQFCSVASAPNRWTVWTRIAFISSIGKMLSNDKKREKPVNPLKHLICWNTKMLLMEAIYQQNVSSCGMNI